MKTIKNRIGQAALLFGCAVIVGLMPSKSSAQTLEHEYSFTNADDGNGNIGALITDSVGGPTWDGVLPAGGDLADLPGELLLTASDQQYVQLPVGILSNYTAVTIDCWATFGTLPVNCFLYGFGATNTSNPSLGINYIFCQPENGRIAITGTNPGYSGEQSTPYAGNLSGLTVHITSVFNPVSGYEEYYTNGILAGVNNNVTTPMSSVSNLVNYIGRSLYAADSYMDVAVDEFRIWNGALSPLQVADCDIAGPDTVGDTSGLSDLGALSNLQLSVPFYQLIQGGNESGTAIIQAANFASPITITRLVTFSSSNTNILSINPTNNAILAVGQGSANVIVTYGGLTATQTITVVQPASTLVHEYSFSDASGSTTVADSVGGSAWNGTLPNGGTLTGSQVQLSAASQQYVQLPSGVTSNYNALTVEAWATFPDALPVHCFFFGFGNTDSSGSGENYIYMQPYSGIIGIGGNDPGWSGEQDSSAFGNLSTYTNVHISAVFNPQANWIAIYTNGVLAGKNTGVTWQMNNITNVLNYIGRSLFTGDSYMDVDVDEFRIYNGALTSQGIAISDAAGPNSIPSGVTNGPGSLLSLSIQAPTTMQVLQTGSVKLLANYTSLANWDIIGNSIFAPAGLTVSVSDTNVLSYANGQVKALNAGTASIITVYQGITNTASITVAQAAAPVLAHRYSFFDQPDGSLMATDTVAGANGTLMGSASIAGGQLLIPNTAQVAPAADYLLLPAGIITNAATGIGTNYNFASVTVETWATLYPSQGYWAALFDFGYTDSSGNGAYDIHLGQLGGSTVYGISDSDNANNVYQSNSAGSIAGQTNIHIVVVFNPPAGYMACYTNGVLASQLNGVTISMAGVWAAVNKIGADVWPDPGMQGSVSEFRIYDGVMSPKDVAATQTLGQTNVLSSSVSLAAAVSGSGSNGSTTLSWPVAGGSYSVQYTTNLTSGVWTTVTTPQPQLSGSQWQVTIPNSSNGNEFFRLVR